MSFCIIIWILYEYITSFDFNIDHETRSKIKIKKLSKSKHIVSKNQQIIVEIFAQFIYKIVLFFDCKMRMHNNHLFEQFNKNYIFEIFAVFAYKTILFFNKLQKLKTFKNRKFRINIRFRFSNLQNNHSISNNCNKNKILFLRYFRHFSIFVLRILLFHAQNVICIIQYSMSKLLCVWEFMLHV